MVNQGRRSIAVAALALASGAGYAILAAAGDLRERGGVFLLVWAVLAAAYLLAIRLARPLEPEGPALCLIIGAAIAFRLVMLCAPVSLSDDVHRYVRDGAAQVEGINPYANAPADDPPSLRAVAGHDAINNPSISTIYPPVAEALFACAVRIHPTDLSIRTAILLFDLAAILLLTTWFRASGRNPLTVIIFAWHPLAIIEGAGSGHVDEVGAFFLVLSVAMIIGGRKMASSAALVGAVLTKLLPLGLLPVFLRELRAKHLLAAASLVAIAFVPYMGMLLRGSPEGLPMSGGFSQYATRWEFNGSVFPIIIGSLEAINPTEHLKMALTAVKSSMGDPEFLVPVYGWLYPETLARAMAGIIALILLIVIARSTRSFERAAFAGIAVLLLLSPTLHPWYLLWVVPFLAFVDSPAWLWLSLSIPLAYMGSNGFGGVQSGGSLTPPASTSWTLPGSGVPVWVSAVEYLPMILLRLTVRKAR